MKPCIICKELKDIEDFNKHPAMADGHINKCKKCEARYKKEHYKKDRAKYIARAKALYRKDPQKVKDRVVKWHKEHPEKHREQMRKAAKTWRKRYLDSVRVFSGNRRARELAAVGQYTTLDIEKLYENQRGKCFYCQKDLSAGYHVDHKIPLSRGGSNWPDNLALACPECNCRKHTKTDIEFFNYLLGV